MSSTINFMQKVGDILNKFEKEKDKFISREFQQYGYDLAVELNDMKRKALYIKMAKRENRGLLEAARSFIKDATTARNKAALFMWKLNQLKKESKSKK